jgi:hypothetical protein
MSGQSADLSAQSSMPPQPNASRLPAMDALRVFVHDLEEYAILLLHRNESILNGNAGAVRLLGHPVDRMIGRKFRTLLAPDDAKRGGLDHDLASSLDEWFYVMFIV